ncbi:MAG: abortive infection system antitoxin AbiGi family protein [Bacteroidota bacterium]
MNHRIDHSTSVNISSNTLFHFTDDINHLLNIFRVYFIPHYCLEVFRFGDLRAEWATPMVSFCDLPAMLIKSHLDTYGPFGIGLSKTWVMKNGLLPVWYIHNESNFFTRHEGLAFQYFHKSIEGGLSFETSRLFTSYSSFMKPYQGISWRRGAYTEEIRFYNEREWRYVPNIDVVEVPDFLNKETFHNRDIKKGFEEVLARECCLKFTPDDIQYIIVPDEDEIIPMIKIIESLQWGYSPDEMKALCTCIISANRIQEDF